MNENVERILQLVTKLNYYRDQYYNHNVMVVSDKDYDDMFDELVRLENQYQTWMSNSPTVTVGYAVQSKLNKITHDHPMLSLAKTKHIKDIEEWAHGMPIIAMLKMDGLTVSLSYDKNGALVRAETRGNGEVGEDVLENAKMIRNIPLRINNNGKPLTIDGEVIINYEQFNNINKDLPEDKKYSHPRNLAAGSLRQLYTRVTQERGIEFVAWRVIANGDDIQTNFADSLEKASNLGFTVVPFYLIEKPTASNIPVVQKILQLQAEKYMYPIDGLVFSYNNMEYGLSLGVTSHHPLHSMAFKFYDDVQETTLRNIEWNTTRTGIVSPVAVFDEIDLDGALTSRSTLFNVSYIKDLELGIGDKVTVFRANGVIPKLKESLTKSGNYLFPTICPCCGKPTTIKKEGVSEIMYCSNPECSAKKLSKFSYFVSKNAMDIDGLSESTLEKLIGNGFISNFADIYHLDNYRSQIIGMEGFGEKSFNNLIEAINKSRNVKLEKFLVALGINLVGKSAARTLAKYFNYSWDKLYEAMGDSHFDFTCLEDFGPELHNSLKNFYDEFNSSLLYQGLLNEVTFVDETNIAELTNDFINGKVFVVTGAFNTMKRSELEQIIVNNGGKLSGSVSKKTNYLLTNETTETTKFIKARDLGIPVMNEEEFLSHII